MTLLPSLAPLALLLATVPAFDFTPFWKHWGDGKAEISTYKLVTPRYGEKREGQAVLIYVTEDMSDSLRVKADPGRHPASDVFNALKLNHVRSFQTGIYDYRMMTSTFVRVAQGFPVAKVSFTSQEWCGQVYHQLLPRGDSIESVSHSYFDGEADASMKILMKSGGVLEDQLWILLRDLLDDAGPAVERTVPLLPSLWSARARHQPLAWTTATISTPASASVVKTAAGSFTVRTSTVRIGDGRTLTFDIEAKGERRIIRWGSTDGETGELIASKRVAYWKLNAPAGEAGLKDLGLRPAGR
jgi:hypothetical protein